MVQMIAINQEMAKRRIDTYRFQTISNARIGGEGEGQKRNI